MAFGSSEKVGDRAPAWGPTAWPKALSTKAQPLSSKRSGGVDPLGAEGLKVRLAGLTRVLHPSGARRLGWQWAGPSSCLSCSFHRSGQCIKPFPSRPLSLAADTTDSSFVVCGHFKSLPLLRSPTEKPLKQRTNWEMSCY